MAFAVRQGLADSFFECGGNWGASEALAFTPGPRKAGTHSFRNHCSLELGKHAQHLKHRLAGGRRRVEPLLPQEQVDLECVQLGIRMTVPNPTSGMNIGG